MMTAADIRIWKTARPHFYVASIHSEAKAGFNPELCHLRPRGHRQGPYGDAYPSGEGGNDREAPLSPKRDHQLRTSQLRVERRGNSSEPRTRLRRTDRDHPPKIATLVTMQFYLARVRGAIIIPVDYGHHNPNR